jgi:hypothetical protein
MGTSARADHSHVAQFPPIQASAIRRFAGEDCEVAHVAARGRELLTRFDPRCLHYELVVDDKPRF